MQGIEQFAILDELLYTLVVLKGRSSSSKVATRDAVWSGRVCAPVCIELAIIQTSTEGRRNGDNALSPPIILGCNLLFG